MRIKELRIIYTDPFLSNIKRLKKSYPHVRDDLQPLIDQLEEGETPGDRLRELHPLEVYKVRLSNYDAKRGKSGGYRVVYYLYTANRIYLVTIYSKTDQQDIALSALRLLLGELDTSQADHSTDDTEQPPDQD